MPKSGVSAEPYFGKSVTETVFARHELHGPLPDLLLDNQLKPFRIEPDEARHLSSMILPELGVASARVPGGPPAYSLIRCSEPPGFYRGALYGLQVSARAIRLFRTQILADPLLIFANIETGLCELSATAAARWLDHAGSRPN